MGKKCKKREKNIKLPQQGNHQNRGITVLLRTVNVTIFGLFITSLVVHPFKSYSKDNVNEFNEFFNIKNENLDCDTFENITDQESNKNAALATHAKEMLESTNQVYNNERKQKTDISKNVKGKCKGSKRTKAMVCNIGFTVSRRIPRCFLFLFRR